MGIIISKLIFNQDSPFKKMKTIKMDVMTQVIAANNKYFILRIKKKCFTYKRFRN